jgi:hypothetical protein
MVVRAVPDLGPMACDCGATVWRASTPANYMSRRITLEESDDAARCRWTMDDDYAATPVGRGNGDLHIHRCDGIEAMGDVDT